MLLISSFPFFLFLRERERDINLLFHLSMHSLIASPMCLDRGSNPQPWRTGQSSNQLSYPARASCHILHERKLVLRFTTCSDPVGTHLLSTCRAPCMEWALGHSALVSACDPAHQLHLPVRCEVQRSRLRAEHSQPVVTVPLNLQMLRPGPTACETQTPAGAVTVHTRGPSGQGVSAPSLGGSNQGCHGRKPLLR